MFAIYAWNEQTLKYDLVGRRKSIRQATAQADAARQRGAYPAWKIVNGAGVIVAYRGKDTTPFLMEED